MMKTTNLNPTLVFHYFEEVCRIPRPSKKEEKIIDYLLRFAKEHQLEAVTDATGNVLIRKPATPGYEDRKTVVLQSHLDMVCEKNEGVTHDFLKDPIETYIDGEWMRARGTTLGADNGIGIATELAILADDSIAHGSLECVFTEDEETGMTGAFGMTGDFMHGDILLNLDSEDEGEMFIGCAGGANTVATFRFEPEVVPAGHFFFRASVKGLTGGHSGDDINKNRANANKVLNRFLVQCMRKYDFRLCQIDGGNLHNAIPREAWAVCAVPMADKENVRIDFNVFAAEVEAEYSVTEPTMRFELSSTDAQATAIDRSTTRRMLLAVHACFNGVFAMSQDIDGLVETSNNLASIKQQADTMDPLQEPQDKLSSPTIRILCSQRSSSASSRADVSQTVMSAFQLAGAEVELGDGYPGWKPNPSSPILAVVVDCYKRLFGKEPKVKAIHAGLECGLFLEKYPHMDMVSFGPTLRGVHSPDERMLIPTVQMFWDHLLEVLKHVPRKQ